MCDVIVYMWHNTIETCMSCLYYISQYPLHLHGSQHWKAASWCAWCNRTYNKEKKEFDWKTLKKSMDNVDKATTTYEHADYSTKDELYGIQSVLKDLHLEQLIIIKPANSLSDIIWQPGSCSWMFAQCNLTKTNQESKVHFQMLREG